MLVMPRFDNTHKQIVAELYNVDIIWITGIDYFTYHANPGDTQIPIYLSQEY